MFNLLDCAFFCTASMKLVFFCLFLMQESTVASLNLTKLVIYMDLIYFSHYDELAAEFSALSYFSSIFVLHN